MTPSDAGYSDGDDGPQRRWALGPVVGAVVGVPVLLYGVWGLVHDGERTRPVDAVRWVVGAAVVHDLVALPLLLVATLVLVRPLPAWMRPTVRTGLAVSAVLALVAWPEIAGYGENPTIPSLLPRDELAGLLAYLAVAWTVAVLVLVRGAMRRRRARGRPGLA